MAQRCLSCMQMTEGGSCPHCGWPGKDTTESHQLAVGTMLRKRYQVGKVLGQGGFGITYLGWDTLLLQTVAIKEFYPSGSVFRRTAVSTQVECATDAMIPHYEYTRERFLREAQALVQFREIPEVVDILDFIEENNTAYIVMEYVRGVDLAKYIALKGGRLSVDETFRILKPVMEALAKVHKGGIVHRDISPDNIILDPMGGAKLLDFGAVRAVEGPEVDKGLNKSTEAILKQGFAPIEQYNTRGSLGPWTDEYAMCATVWYCLTGRVPEEASIRMGEGIDPDWSSIEGLPEHQQKALQKGFSCRARDRYKSMDELLADLFPEAEQAPPAELPKAEIPKEAEAPEKAAKQSKAHRSGGKNRALIFTAVAAAIVLVLLTAVFFLPGKQETSPSQLQEAPGTLPSEAPGQTAPTAPSIPETVPPTEPLSEEELCYLQAEQLLAEGKLGEAAIAFGKLAGFSDARERSFEIWDQIAVRDTVSAGHYYTVGLKVDGTVVAVGTNRDDVEGWTDIVAVSLGDSHAVGLKSDGTVLADGFSGRRNVANWTDIVAISAANSHTVGLKLDGTVVAISDVDGFIPCNVEDWTNIVAIDAGMNHTVGLKADGTVIAVGTNAYGECDVEEWTDIVAIAAGYYHTIGLKADGTVVATGRSIEGQCNIEDWSSIVAISAGGSHTVGLKADGTVIAIGYDGFGQANVDDWSDIVAINAGCYHTVGLRSDGTVVAVGINWEGQCNVSGWTDIRIPQRTPWYSQGDPSAEATLPEEDSANAEAYANAERLLAEGKLGEAAIAFGKLSGFSDARERSFEIWDKITVRDTVGAGLSHTVGLKTDGTVIALGSDLYDQCDVNGWTDIVAVSAGSWHTVGLKADRTVVAVGGNESGKCDVESWTDIVAVSAGSDHTVGLRADGTVVAVGNNDYGQCAVSKWSDIVAVSAGGNHTVGLRADGTVVAVGRNDKGQCDVEGRTDIVAVSTNSWQTVGLRADGSVVAVGRNDEGQCDVEGWTDIVAVSAGYWHTVGLRADGTVVAVGSNSFGQCGMAHWAPWTDMMLPQKPVPFR